MKLSIIIVSYNTKDLTIQTLESIEKDLKTSKELEDEVEVIVVDNNSEDGSPDAIQQYSHTVHFPVILIKNSTNDGFAKANNEGITRARGDYYLLLNSDTIVQKGAIETLISTFEKYPIDQAAAVTEHSNKTDNLGIISPSLLYPDRSYQPQGGSFPSLVTLFFHMTMLDDLPFIGILLPSTQHTGKQQLSLPKKNFIFKDWVGGTAMMIRKEVIREIGLLDDAIFMYGEDTEFCMRARHHAWDIAEVPTAKIIHIQNASSSSANAIRGEFKSYLYIWSKHKALWQIPFVRGLLYTGAFLRVILFGTMVKNKEKTKIYRELIKEMRNW